MQRAKESARVLWALVSFVFLLLVANGWARAYDSVTPEWKIRFAWLGQTLRAAGFEPTKASLRYDFRFSHQYDGQPWQFTMSAVLSQDGETLWLLAWLGTVPEDTQAVNAQQLLQLLALNDKIAPRRFFAYLPTYKRLVLEQPISLQNRRLDGKTLRQYVIDFGKVVASTYPHWSLEEAAGSLVQANTTRSLQLTEEPSNAGPSNLNASENLSGTTTQNRRHFAQIVVSPTPTESTLNGSLDEFRTTQIGWAGLEGETVRDTSSQQQRTPHTTAKPSQKRVQFFRRRPRIPLLWLPLPRKTTSRQ